MTGVREKLGHGLVGVGAGLVGAKVGVGCDRLDDGIRALVGRLRKQGHKVKDLMDDLGRVESEAMGEYVFAGPHGQENTRFPLLVILSHPPTNINLDWPMAVNSVQDGRAHVLLPLTFVSIAELIMSITGQRVVTPDQVFNLITRTAVVAEACMNDMAMQPGDGWYAGPSRPAVRAGGRVVGNTLLERAGELGVVVLMSSASAAAIRSTLVLDASAVVVSLGHDISWQLGEGTSAELVVVGGEDEVSAFILICVPHPCATSVGPATVSSATVERRVCDALPALLRSLFFNEGTSFETYPAPFRHPFLGVGTWSDLGTLLSKSQAVDISECELLPEDARRLTEMYGTCEDGVVRVPSSVVSPLTPVVPEVHLTVAELEELRSRVGTTSTVPAHIVSGFVAPRALVDPRWYQRFEEDPKLLEMVLQTYGLVVGDRLPFNLVRRGSLLVEHECDHRVSRLDSAENIVRVSLEVERGHAVPRTVLWCGELTVQCTKARVLTPIIQVPVEHSVAHYVFKEQKQRLDRATTQLRCTLDVDGGGASGGGAPIDQSHVQVKLGTYCMISCRDGVFVVVSPPTPNSWIWYHTQAHRTPRSGSAATVGLDSGVHPSTPPTLETIPLTAWTGARRGKPSKVRVHVTVLGCTLVRGDDDQQELGLEPLERKNGGLALGKQRKRFRVSLPGRAVRPALVGGAGTFEFHPIHRPTRDRDGEDAVELVFGTYKIEWVRVEDEKEMQIQTRIAVELISNGVAVEEGTEGGGAGSSSTTTSR